MKAGYEIDQYGIKNFTTIHVYNWGNKIGLVQWDHTHLVASNYLVAIFKNIRIKVPCDHCDALTKDNPNDEGYIYCQKCQDNRDEEQGTKFLNDAENFTNNNYSQYKSLK